MNIEINNKSYPIFFGLMAQEMFEKSKLNTDTNGAHLVNMVWAGIKNAAFRENEELKISFKDVYDAVEDMTTKPNGKDWITGIGKAYRESEYVSKLAKAMDDSKPPKDEIKKKGMTTGKKSKPSPVENLD